MWTLSTGLWRHCLFPEIIFLFLFFVIKFNIQLPLWSHSKHWLFYLQRVLFFFKQWHLSFIFLFSLSIVIILHHQYSFDSLVWQPVWVWDAPLVRLARYQPFSLRLFPFDLWIPFSFCPSSKTFSYYSQHNLIFCHVYMFILKAEKNKLHALLWLCMWFTM